MLDPEYWCMSYLRPMQQEDLAKTGDSDQKQLLCEVTVTCKNHLASAKIYSCTTA